VVFYSKVRTRPINLFSMLEALNLNVWLFTAISIFSVAAIASILMFRPMSNKEATVKRRSKIFFKYLWYSYSTIMAEDMPPENKTSIR